MGWGGNPRNPLDNMTLIVNDTIGIIVNDYTHVRD
jgi:hypothetical protein